MSNSQSSIKIDTFTHQVLKDAKELTGKSITRIIKDLVRSEYPARYEREEKK